MMNSDMSHQDSPVEAMVLSDASYSSGDEEVAEAASPRKVNPSGKPPEAGIIVKVYVENFMCHKKMSIPLCHNVNFIHGQNGSGKVSAGVGMGWGRWYGMGCGLFPQYNISRYDS
jgi:hypothetical protein